MKTRRLTAEEHRARLSMGVCPRCGDFRLVRVMRVRSSEEPGGSPKFAGSFYACGGPDAHECYHLSGDTGTALSESAEGNEPVVLPKPSTGDVQATVIRRRKK